MSGRYYLGTLIHLNICSRSRLMAKVISQSLRSRKKKNAETIVMTERG